MLNLTRSHHPCAVPSLNPSLRLCVHLSPVVQARDLHRSPALSPSAAAAAGAHGFALTLHVGLFHSASAAAASSSSAGCATEAAAAHPQLHAGPDGSAVWNAETELECRNADSWLWVRAHAAPLHDETHADGPLSPSAGGTGNSDTPPAVLSPKDRRRSRLAAAALLPGEARIPLKEYEAGCYHDLWLTLRPPVSATHTASAVTAVAPHPFVAGTVHVRFMYRLEESGQLAALALLPPPLGGLAQALLSHDALWLQVVLAHMQNLQFGSESAGSGAPLLQAVLCLLSHARFALLLHVLERLIAREIDDLARQLSGTGVLTSAWASNLFRRNSLTPKLMSAFCLQQQSSHAAAGGGGPFVREGAGKQFLAQLLTPFIQRVVHEVTHASPAAGAPADASSNPFEIDPARLGHDRALVARNQESLIRACQALLDHILASMPAAAAAAARDRGQGHGGDDVAARGGGDSSSALTFWPGSHPPPVPGVPQAIRVVARSLKRTVEEYVASTATRAASLAVPAAEGLSSSSSSAASATDADGAAAAPGGPAVTTAAAAASGGANGGGAPPHSTSPSPDCSPAGLRAIAHESTSNSLASFFFLRFLCPALVAPSHYGLASRPPPPAASRALILMAKALQSLVNTAGSATSAHHHQGQGQGQGEDEQAAAAPLSQNARLFKEPFMECFYPFINANLARVSSFLDDLAQPEGGAGAAGAGKDARPGVEEPLDSFAAAPAAGSVTVLGGEEASPHRELERALWLLAPFLQAHLAGLEEAAARMHAEGQLRVPARATWPAGAGAGGSGSGSSTPLPATEPGLAVLKELTRPRQSDLALRPSSSPSEAADAANGLGSPTASGLQVAAFIARFRGVVLPIQVPPAAAAESAHMDRRGASSTPPGGSSRSATPTPPPTTTTGANASAPASALQQAASSSFKFLARFLPIPTTASSSGSAANSAPNTPLSSSPPVVTRPRHAEGVGPAPAPLSLVVAPAPAAAAGFFPPFHRSASAAVSGSNGSSRGGGNGGGQHVFGSSSEEFQLFKQTNVEIQLRLGAQLEDAEARVEALQGSCAEAQAAALAQQQLIQELQRALRESEEKNARLELALAAATAAAADTAAAAAAPPQGPPSCADAGAASDPTTPVDSRCSTLAIEGAGAGSDSDSDAAGDDADVDVDDDAAPSV